MISKFVRTFKTVYRSGVGNRFGMGRVKLLVFATYMAKLSVSG